MYTAVQALHVAMWGPEGFQKELESRSCTQSVVVSSAIHLLSAAAAAVRVGSRPTTHQGTYTLQALSPLLLPPLCKLIIRSHIQQLKWVSAKLIGIIGEI